MKKGSYWYKVDNAGKIFPAVSNSARSNVFRLSFYIDEIVDEIVLQYAVNECLKRFETFNLQLKHGVFWFYLANNDKPFIVEKEPPIICKYFKTSKNNNYLFKIYYQDNKITMETFHAITDATGALAFLKSVVYKYFTVQGYDIDNEGMILGEKPFSKKENQDMFVGKYDKTKKMALKEEKAYILKGNNFKDNFMLLIKTSLNSENFNNTIKEKYNVTVSQYITALLAYSIYNENYDVATSKKPLKMFVPTNLRRFFPSETLRNFSLYIKVTYDCFNRNYTFKEMLEMAKEQFAAQLDKDILYQRSNSNVGLEKNIFVRISPLFLKNIIFKIGYQMLGETINTCSISNLGIVKLPKQMEDKVLDIEFMNGGDGIALTGVAYKDRCNLFFVTNKKEVGIINRFIQQLKEDGQDVVLDTNYMEEYDEIL